MHIIKEVHAQCNEHVKQLNAAMILDGFISSVSEQCTLVASKGLCFHLPNLSKASSTFLLLTY